MSEDAALRGLADAQKKLQIAIEFKKSLQIQLEQTLQEREQLGVTPTPAAGFQFIQTFIVGVKQRIVNADQSILKANRGVDKAMRVYLNAKRQTRMIEILKEKQFAEFKVYVKKAEQKEQSELTIMRAHLGPGEGSGLE